MNTRIAAPLSGTGSPAVSSVTQSVRSPPKRVKNSRSVPSASSSPSVFCRTETPQAIAVISARSPALARSERTGKAKGRLTGRLFSSSPSR